MKANHSKWQFFLTALIFGTFFVADASPPQYPTALEALSAFEKSPLRSSTDATVGLVGFYGQDQPRQWLVLTKDTRMADMMHEFVVSEGKVLAQRHFKRLPDQDIPSVPLKREDIKIDSREVFQKVESLAAKVNVGFDSIHYQLRCRDLRNEPVWMLNLIDAQQVSVGVHYISAMDGEVLRSVWHPRQQQTAQGPVKPVTEVIKKVANRARGTVQNARKP